MMLEDPYHLPTKLSELNPSCSALSLVSCSDLLHYLSMSRQPEMH